MSNLNTGVCAARILWVITSGHSNLTKGRIAAAHGRFYCIRHVVPMCTPPNTLGLHASLGHPSPQPKRHLDRFSRFCRVHDRDRQTESQTTQLRL